MKSISMQELKQILGKKKINLIDIRSYPKYLENSIVGSINIEADKLINAPAKYLNFNEEYYIFCEYGYTSSKVVHLLNNLGYNVINVLGGFSSYN